MAEKILNQNSDKQANEQLVFVMHELHTSLNSITSKLHFLSRRDLSRRDEQELVKQGILDACSYADTIRMFLDYLQLSSNPKDYFLGTKMRLVDLWTVFKYPNEYFKSIMKKKRIIYNVEKKDERIPNIEAFPIIHAIANILLDNAIKYAPNDSEIDCSFETDGNDLVITIENDGPYLTEDEIKNIFKKGVRGKNAEKSDIRGHGFGMDFLNCIIEAHDGEVKIKSDNNYMKEGIPYGTFCCVIYLPIE